MKKILLIAMVSCFGVAFSQSTGDIAFVGYNADGDDDFAFVILAEITSGTEVYFTDNEWGGTAFVDTNEGIITWTATTTVSAGTVIVVTDASSGSSRTVNNGSLSGSGPFNLGASNEAMFAYVGTDGTTPTTFLAAICNDLSGSGATLTGTGLTEGINAIDFGNDNDGFAYSASRSSESSYSGYLTLINSTANWTDAGSNGEILLPFSTTEFLLAGSQSVGFDATTSDQTETDATFSVDIPLTLSNYSGAQVDLSVTIDASSTAEPGDYTLNTTSLSFTSSTTQNISISINDDADDDNETLVLNVAETTSTGISISVSQHTITITDDEIPSIIITEMMYNTSGADDEWIELYNANGSDVDVSNWTIEVSSTTKFTFSSSTILTNGSYYTIALGSEGTAPFNPDNGFTPNFNAMGVNNSSVETDNSLTNQMTNSSGTITLKTDAGSVADEVSYDDGNDNRTDGAGPSYEIIDLTVDNSNTSSNWQASVADGGSPGAVSAVTVWTGATNTDWATAGNWSNGLPSASLNAMIPDVSGASNNAANITGSVTLNDINIASGVTVTISSEASLIINEMATGAGQVTINKNTTHSTTDGKYSIIGSPVTSGMTSSLGGIVYKYDETIAYGTDGNTRFTEVTTAESMAAGDAYFSANTGAISFTGTPNAGTVTQTLVYDETTDGSATNAGFNLVSNPYTAAIDVDALVAGNSDISASVYLWQDESSNTTAGSNDDYVVYNSTTNLSTRTTSGGKDFDGFVRSTQGFFVKATAAASLNFTASMMSTGNNDDAGFYRKANENENFLRLSLNHKESYSDIIVLLRDNAALGFDRLYDAHKIGGSNMSFYSFIDNAKFAIQGLPQLSSEVTVDLGFDVEEAGTYTMNFEEGMFDGRVVYLLDTELNKRINLSEAKSYTFESAQVASSDRFQLVLSSAAILSIDDITASSLNVFTSTSVLNVQTLEAYDNVNIKVLSLNGAVALEARNVDLSTKAWSIPFNKNGLFIIAIETKDGLLVKKFLN